MIGNIEAYEFFLDSRLSLELESRSRSGTGSGSSEGKSDETKLGEAKVEPASLFVRLMELGLALPGRRAVASASSLRKASTSRSNLTRHEHET